MHSITLVFLEILQALSDCAIISSNYDEFLCVTVITFDILEKASNTCTDDEHCNEQQLSAASILNVQCQVCFHLLLIYDQINVDQQKSVIDIQEMNSINSSFLNTNAKMSKKPFSSKQIQKHFLKYENREMLLNNFEQKLKLLVSKIVSHGRSYVNNRNNQFILVKLLNLAWNLLKYKKLSASHAIYSCMRLICDENQCQIDKDFMNEWLKYCESFIYEMIVSHTSTADDKELISSVPKSECNSSLMSCWYLQLLELCEFRLKVVDMLVQISPSAYDYDLECFKIVKVLYECILKYRDYSRSKKRDGRSFVMDGDDIFDETQNALFIITKESIIAKCRQYLQLIRSQQFKERDDVRYLIEQITDNRSLMQQTAIEN